MSKLAKSHFMGIRVDEDTFEWMRKFSEDTDTNISGVVRQALIELCGRVDAVRDSKDKADIELLKEHCGEMFRFRQTEEGLLLERIEPQTIVLGSGERRKKDAAKSAATIAVAKGA